MPRLGVKPGTSHIKTVLGGHTNEGIETSKWYDQKESKGNLQRKHQQSKINIRTRLGFEPGTSHVGMVLNRTLGQHAD